MHLAWTSLALGSSSSAVLRKNIRAPTSLALLQPHEPAEPVAEGKIGIEVEGLLEGRVGLLRLVDEEEDLRLVAHGLGDLGELFDQLSHRLLGGGRLLMLELMERLFDVPVVRLAAPFELFAATARATGIRRRWP